VALIALAALVTSDAEGQGGEGWTQSRLRRGFCIEFLADSGEVRDLLPDGAMPLRADRVGDLHPALARAIREQPEFAAWAPAEICYFVFDQLEVAGKQLQPTGTSGEMLGLFSIAARQLDDGGRGADVLRQLFSSNWRARKAVENGEVKIETVPFTLGPIPKTSDERMTTKLGRTQLRWDGHVVVGDSAPVPGPLTRRWLVRGDDRRDRLMTLRLAPTSSRSMVGTLNVQGKDRLAKLLRASPIRYLGPEYRGGDGIIDFE
jgi:hypothetical protein